MVYFTRIIEHTLWNLMNYLIAVVLWFRVNQIAHKIAYNSFGADGLFDIIFQNMIFKCRARKWVDCETSNVY